MTKYTLKFTTQFKKDYKLAIKRGLKIDLLEQIVANLADGLTLPERKTVSLNITMGIWLPNIFENFGELRWIFVGIGAGLTGAAASAILSKKYIKTILS